MSAKTQFVQHFVAHLIDRHEVDDHLHVESETGGSFRYGMCD
jgi:hypothetical protein